MAARAGKYVLVIDNKESKPYDQVVIDPVETSTFKPFQIITVSSDGKGGQEFFRVTGEP